MQPNRPPTRYFPRGRFRIPTPKPVRQLSLLAEYPYLFLLAFLALAIVLAKGAGLSLWDAAVLGSWLTSLVFFGWQLLRYLKFRANPQAALKEEAARKQLLNAQAQEATKQQAAKPPAAPAPKPKIAVVPRKPAQRVPIRKPGMNVKPQPQSDQKSDQTPKT